MPKHIEKIRRRYYAVLRIPKDIRHKFGKIKFLKTLETEDKTIAERRAKLLVAQWQAKIAAARAESTDPLEADLRFWRDAWETEKVHGSEEIDEEGRVIGGSLDILRDHLIELAEKMDRKLPGSGERFYKRVTGEVVDTMENVQTWIAGSDVTQRTKDARLSDVQRMAHRFPTLNEIRRKDVQVWAASLIESEGLAGNTMRRILTACREYWKYLKALELVPDDSAPFDGLNLPKVKHSIRGGDKRKAFTPGQVVELLNKAVEKEDQQLADLIRLGMWTGARIESLCSLKVEDVREQSFMVNEDKTEAGTREVPIHSKLKSTMDRLVKDSKDGYILSGLTFNKYRDRSNAVGKRFGRLKSKLGHGPELVFHSIRKTVATIMEDAGVPENVTADILGHEKRTMTYGLYSAGVSLETKINAIEKMSYE